MIAMTAGIDLKNQGVAATIAADTAANRLASPIIRDSIEAFAAQGQEFTADDVREALAGNSDVVRALHDRPNLLPAVFSGAAKSGRIEAVGYTRATRSSRHASVLRIWQGVAA